MTITRQEYLSNSNQLHEQYYGQMVTPVLREYVVRTFTLETLKVAYGRDPHFNTLPLRQWDRMSRVVTPAHLLTFGEGWSLATAVCVLKAAARQAVQEH